MEGAGSRKGALTEEYMRFLKRMGQPFGIVTTLTASSTTQYFNLDDQDYDWDGDGTDDTDPFKDLALVVTGFRVVVAASATLADFIVDEKAILPPDTANNTNAATYSWRGFPKSTGSTDTNETNAEAVFGGPLIIRRRFGARAGDMRTGAVAADLNIAVQLYGFAVPRRLV